MWNLKYDINELICEQKQTYRQREQACDYQGGGECGREGLGGWDWQTQTIIYGMDKQGPRLKLREPYNIVNQVYSIFFNHRIGRDCG